MPKIGMEEVRRQQLIDATLASVEEHGLQGTTISTISKLAGVSSGIISHYFGGKQALLEATVRYLLEQLRQDLLAQVAQGASPKERLMMIVEANFTRLQSSGRAAKTWLAFWAQSMHSEDLARLQRVNAARLEANLRYSFKALIDPFAVKMAAQRTAAMIDGFWLRSALNRCEEQGFDLARESCKAFIQDMLSKYAKGKRC
ncbi:transcriptional regulator BetI [Aliiglaciecola sp. CAU 1673]|uniref:transcriptional regulator BetI n=1 Tax=Aliiglaciecola sp. CAU 1673 TaxID=3032595 RepID=UPI0023DA871E|nr:transcriptional regulator BetI [Aliiglaciecola sp. CAU 1673]MDF2177792.1 transcriptional regulator BetI [Aliiglaciecola sp. CAU 1673]